MGQGRAYPTVAQAGPAPSILSPPTRERSRPLLTPRTSKLACRSGLCPATPGNLPTGRCRGSQAGTAPHQADRDTSSVRASVSGSRELTLGPVWRA